MKEDEERYVSTKDVADHFGVTQETIRKWVKDEGLPADRPNRSWKYKMSEVRRWAANREHHTIHPTLASNAEPSDDSAATRSDSSELRKAVRLPSPQPVAGPFRNGETCVLYNGDCVSAIGELPTHSIDLLLTDPPYNLGLFMKDRATNLKRMRDNYFGAAGWDDLCGSEWAESMKAFFTQAARVLKKGGSLIVFMAVIKVETVIRIAEECGFYYKTTGTWHKKNPMPRNMNLHFINSTEVWIYFTIGSRTGTFNNNGVAVHDFIETSVTPKSERSYGKHPTQKPVGLMRHFIGLLTNVGDTVLDPFMGSGSTGVAALEEGRSFVGVELNEGYYQMARSRIEGIRR